MSVFSTREITHLTCDSRTAGNHSCFVCLEGLNTDGHFYAASAYQNGCRMFVCRRPLDLPDDAYQMLCPDTRIALAELSAEFFDRPAEKLCLIGITGTKGKSTVAELIREILNRGGIPTDSIGTNGMTVGGVWEPTENSTPESLVLHEAFSRMVKAGTACCVMEVSSQAYKMHRVHGITFDIGVYTNLSDDHIGPGEHENFEEYRDCKAKLFENCRYAVINSDDAYGQFMAEHTNGNLTFYGLGKDADLRAEAIELYRNGSDTGIRFRLNGITYTMPLPGTFNAYNALAAIAVADKWNVSRSVAAQALRSAFVIGRFEQVPCLPDRTFLIDYAHNGLSLQSALGALRAYRPKRLICLFGSVGDRTQIRRRELGDAAGRLADFCVITSDNPGKEEPMKIIREIEQWIGDCPHVCIADRTEAIRWTVAHSQPGDLILFAGKGHETYQLVGTEKLPFCEADIIRSAASSVKAEI